MRILRKLGIYGLDELDDIIMVSLINGDPVLLVGKHGSAKTLLARRLSNLLNLKYQEYDASKALFEDVIGFPNPDSLCRGVIEYTPTPMSIWGKEFVFIDEISRASPMMQNKWLEIIRSRQVMGTKIGSVQYVFSAMNPPGYLGSMPLDEALAGRFSAIISIPDVSQMELCDIKLVMSSRSEDDSPGLAQSASLPYEEIRSPILAVIEEARSKVMHIERRYGEYLSVYLVQFLAAMKYHNRPLDGRRLGMIRRNIISYLALKNTDNGTRENINHSIYKMVNFSLPYRAFGDDIYAGTLKNIHSICIENAMGENGASAAHFKIFLSEDKYKMIDNYKLCCREMTENEHYSVVSHIESSFDESKNLPKHIEAVFALGKLSRLYQKIRINVPNDVIRKTLNSFCSRLFGPEQIRRENQMIMYMIHSEQIISGSGRFLNVNPSEFSDCAAMLLNIVSSDFNPHRHTGNHKKMIESYIGISSEINEFTSKHTAV